MFSRLTSVKCWPVYKSVLFFWFCTKKTPNVSNQTFYVKISIKRNWHHLHAKIKHLPFICFEADLCFIYKYLYIYLNIYLEYCFKFGIGRFYSCCILAHLNYSAFYNRIWLFFLFSFNLFCIISNCIKLS